MKKKYRDIVVDGKHYTWMYTKDNLRIWYNKKEIYCNNDIDITVTPQYIAELISYVETYGNIEGK